MRDITDFTEIPLTGAQFKTVSVIMPIRNEAGYIHDSLLSVLNQDYPKEWVEVLVVDGMSDDGTREIVTELKKVQSYIRLIDNPGKIVPIGLNIALQEAKGEIIVRVDGHCQINQDYVRKCVEYLGREDIAGVGGPMETIGETDIAQGIALAMSSPFGVGGSAFRTVKNRTMLVDSVAFPAYRRETIRENGLFDEELVRNQDDEYNYRLRSHGGKILLTSDIQSRYFSRSSFKSLWRQYFQYGYWKVRVMQKHPRQMMLRQFVPPAFVGFLVLFSLLSLFSVYALYLLITGFIAYVLANLAASAWTASQYGWRYIPYLMASFAILHISYGAGFLYGIFKFANRWKANTQAGARDA